MGKPRSVSAKDHETGIAIDHAHARPGALCCDDDFTLKLRDLFESKGAHVTAMRVHAVQADASGERGPPGSPAGFIYLVHCREPGAKKQ